MNPIICQAINERRLLRIDYTVGMRTVEPHAYGESAGGDELLRAFQVGGPHADPGHDWDLFRLDRAGAIQILDAHFDGPRPGYRRDDSAMKGGIFCQL
tara:strand:+ start:383 stop:676 length:294 start_codon:yes stop_codon:yes gene_type:complete